MLPHNNWFHRTSDFITRSKLLFDAVNPLWLHLKIPKSLSLGVRWIWFAGFWCGLNLNTESWSWCPSPLKTQTFTLSSPIQPQTLCFGVELPSFLYGTPRWPSFLPPCLSLSFCSYLGAARAPLLRLLLKREYIQWGLSQLLSVSIKDPGNTTLSTEPLLKGQWPGLYNLSSITSRHFHGKWKKTGIYRADQWFMNSMWTVQAASPLSKHTHSHLRHHRPMGIRYSGVYLDYSWGCFSLFWLKQYVQRISHADDIILVMWTNNTNSLRILLWLLQCIYFIPAWYPLWLAVTVNETLVCRVK